MALRYLRRPKVEYKVKGGIVMNNDVRTQINPEDEPNVLKRVATPSERPDEHYSRLLHGLH